MDRRKFLATISTLAAVGVAGCSQSGRTGSPTDSPSATPESTATKTSSSTAMGTETATATATPTEDSMGGDTATSMETPTGTPTETERPPVAAEVTVGKDGKFKFAPESVTITEGETVRWVWAAGGHNVKPENIPGESDWTGTPGGDGKTFDKGYVYTHTFEVAGRYRYKCVPHASLDMKGTVVVE